MKPAKTKKELSAKQREVLLGVLQSRFEKNPKRHAGIDWAKVQARLLAKPEQLWLLSEMERTGGEPDVVGQDKKTGEFLFVDCAAQSPDARASLCYDREALEGRKKFPPKGCVTEAAAAMGVALLTEEQYVELAENAAGNPDARRRNLRRSPVQPGVHRPQRRRFLLQRPRIPRRAASLDAAVRYFRPPASCRENLIRSGAA